MGKLKSIRKLIAVNFRALVGFELTYKTACSVLLIPIVWNAFHLVMRMSGYAYLTLENIGAFLKNPLTILFLILLFLLATTFAMIDISAVVFALDQSAQGHSVHFWQMLRFSVKNALRVWNPRNAFLIVVVLLLLPLLNAGMASGFLSAIALPEFVTDYIRANSTLSLLVSLVMLALVCLMMRWLYAFHYFTLEGCTFREARRRSAALSRSRRWKDFFSMILAEAAFAGLSILALLLVAMLASLIGRLFCHVFVLRWLSFALVWLMLVILLLVGWALSLPVSYACVSVLFYLHKAESGEPIVPSEAVEYTRSERRARAVHLLDVALITAVAAGSLALGFYVNTGRMNLQIEYVRAMEVTAHRGASAFYPENTMAAFEGAKEMGADWIELDVQQTKDGQIIVLHDTNLKRTTGVNANTWEMTYEQIAELDAGSLFSEEFAGERIPLLSEVAAYAEENWIRLNIELKPTGHETDFEKAVVDIIREAGIEDSCVVTSQEYRVLERVKAYDASVQTVYVMSLAYGDITQLTAADHFSVEATSVTKALVSRVHGAGKQLFVWTVNSEAGITRMAELNVDNIITDDIVLAKQCIYESRYSDLLAEYLKLFR